MVKGGSRNAGRAVRDAYKWDIFISYARSPSVSGWLDTYFEPELRDWIRNEFGIRDPRIFIDRTDIRTGDEWERKLGVAVRDSIFMVPILTAEYCRSRWCRTEWKAFAARERFLPTRLQRGAAGLIFPVKYSDGDHFEKWVLKKQILDLSEWAYSSSAFRGSPEFMAFQRAMRDFVRQSRQMSALLKSPPVPRKKTKVKKESRDKQVPSKMPLPRFRTDAKK